MDVIFEYLPIAILILFCVGIWFLVRLNRKHRRNNSEELEYWLRMARSRSSNSAPSIIDEFGEIEKCCGRINYLE